MNYFKHLQEINMAYVPHMARALKLSFLCLTTSGKLLVHALHPDTYTETISTLKKELP